MSAVAQEPAKKRRSLPLAARFTLFVCSFVLLVGLTAIFVLRGEGDRQADLQMRAMMTGVGQGYTKPIGVALETGNWTLLDRASRFLADMPGVLKVEVLNNENKVYWRGAGSHALAHPKEKYGFRLPVVGPHGAVVGWVQYEVAAEAFVIPRSESLTRALLGLIAIMLLAAPLTILMVRRTTAPLRQLTAFAESVGANRLTMQIDIKTGDEFETLARAFNHMIGRLDASMRRIQRLAFVDPVTDLPNADRLQRDLKAAIDVAVQGGAPGAVFLLHLDRLHRATETLGQEAAHDLIGASAVRLAAAVRAADPWTQIEGAKAPPPVLARLSATEFAVLFPTLPKGVELRAVANGLIQPFDQSFEWREHRLSLGCLLGAAFFPRDGSNADEVMRHARLALNAARETPLRMRFFTRSLDRAATAKLNLEKEMRIALEQNQFRAYFQPKVNLRTGRIVGAEALARWIRPDRSVISPGKFIPAAEEMGLIGPISESILRDACWKAAAWSREGLVARVAVNVSSLQFADESFPQKVMKILDQAGLPAQCLELEITESVAMEDVERATRMIEPLRQAGVRFAIDDFGTGHSSLAALTRLPFEVLKIDQSFVRGLRQEGQSAAIVETILAMAASLNFDAVAEGVETEEEAEFLRRRGCPTAQGFLYSAAVAQSDYLRLLREGSIQVQKPATPALDPAV